MRAVDVRAAVVLAAGVRAAGVRAGPAWVVVGLLAIAVLSTGMAAGSTGGAVPTTATASMIATAATGRSIVARQAQIAVAAVLRPIALGASVGRTSDGTSGTGQRSASLLLGPRSATMENATVRSPAVSPATPRPTAAPALAASPRPKAAPRPALTVRAKPAPFPSATPRPKATPAPTTNGAKKPPDSVPAATPRPAPKPKASPPAAPAIVYQHRVAGSATWGQFGGAVITRLAPGTHIRVCGRLGCWEGVSSGYGPSRQGGNLVDLDAAVFRRICGPLAVGVGSIVLSWR